MGSCSEKVAAGSPQALGERGSEDLTMIEEEGDPRELGIKP